MGIQSGEWRGRGVSRSEWRAQWRAQSSLISTAEAAEPPAEVVDDAETEDEPTIPLASLSEATIKRGHHLHNTPSSFITPAAPLQAPVPPHTPHSGGQVRRAPGSCPPALPPPPHQ